MEHIFPLVGNAFLEPSHFDPHFLPAVAPLCFSGELPLEMGKFAQVFGEVLVGWMFHAVGGDDK